MFYFESDDLLTIMPVLSGVVWIRFSATIMLNVVWEMAMLKRQRHRLESIGPFLFLGLLFLLILTRVNQPKKTQYAGLSAYFDYGNASVPISQVTPLPASQLQIIAQTNVDRASNQIDLVLDTDVYQNEVALLSQELQTALDYVQQRTAIQLNGRIKVIISQDESCGFHGITYSDARVIYIYSCAGIPRSRVVNIAAHEFVHQLEQDRYGEPHLNADLVLSEGFATWGAGAYWLGGNPDFATFARNYRASGQALPLGTHYANVGIGGMNVLYYQWASFVDYLLRMYGRESFDALYVSGGARQPGGANYQAVYGKTFAALEAEWQNSLEVR